MRRAGAPEFSRTEPSAAEPMSGSEFSRAEPSAAEPRSGSEFSRTEPSAAEPRSGSEFGRTEPSAAEPRSGSEFGRTSRTGPKQVGGSEVSRTDPSPAEASRARSEPASGPVREGCGRLPFNTGPSSRGTLAVVFRAPGARPPPRPGQHRARVLVRGPDGEAGTLARELGGTGAGSQKQRREKRSFRRSSELCAEGAAAAATRDRWIFHAMHQGGPVSQSLCSVCWSNTVWGSQFPE
ncbi:uncharacterized protein LOC109022604 [Parus major]|uniref:uncharacterized protein LOC109022604 n=1 Tax=Parus major TaxID=9157 RepID=UPI0008F48213|nr:uncharacterized protein LOC109022604 [Parus major]